MSKLCNKSFSDDNISLLDMTMYTFKTKDVFDRNITLIKKRYEHIISRPEMRNSGRLIKDTLGKPDKIMKSNHAENVWLYYKHYQTTPVSEKYLCVIVKILNKEGFIITSFFTDRIKKGEKIWEK